MIPSRSIIRTGWWLWFAVSILIVAFRLLLGWRLERELWLLDPAVLLGSLSAAAALLGLLVFRHSVGNDLPVGSSPAPVLLSMLGSRKHLTAVSRADFELELTRNAALAQSTPTEQQAQLKGYEVALEARFARLRQVLVGSFASMASAVLLGLASVELLGIAFRTAAVASVFCFAWATLGRLGWQGQSIKGATAPERLDQWIFHVLYWLGMFLATHALA